ncbi:MAG: DNA repair protein RecO [bacterium]|nr:DNA repair protein RecO [bacterium]
MKKQLGVRVNKMFTHYRTQGFIFKKTDRGEYDRIFTVYTKDFGKLELLAKSERKINSKLRNGLELFYLSDIEFIQGKGYKTLTDVAVINNFKGIRNDFGKLVLVFKISNVLDSLINGQELDLKIWGLLQETFERINNSETPGKIIYYYFLWSLFSILGYRPDLYFCSACHKKIVPHKIYFNFKAGGVICGSCSKSFAEKDSFAPPLDETPAVEEKEISQNTIKIIRIILKNEWDVLEKLKVDEEDLRLLKIFSKQYCMETLRKI